MNPNSNTMFFIVPNLRKFLDQSVLGLGFIWIIFIWMNSDILLVMNTKQMM